MDKFEKLLTKIENPQVFTGLEINRLNSEFNRKNVNICLVFPDKYKIGMSHQGMKILYHLLGEMEGVNVERAFLPDKEAIEVFRDEGVPLFSLENRVPLKDFDFIGFSILSELSYTNILLTLHLAGIPFKTEDRGRGNPVIAMGGISAAANPEPLRDFIDIVAIGDGEILFPEIVRILKTFKRDKIPTDLSNFERIEGIYVPSLHPVKKSGNFFTPQLPLRSVKKQVLKKLRNNFEKQSMIVPLTDVVFNRLETEIARGCPQNCRFCQAKAYYSPFRIKESIEIRREYEEQLAKTGFESMSLSSLSSGDHPDIDTLVRDAASFPGSCISVSLPSLRPSTLTDSMLSSISKFRKTGITIVPEAGSDRLRNVINKDVSEKEILDAVTTLVSKGWQKIKLYFMIGLPTETDEDIEAIIHLVQRILSISKKLKRYIRLNISFSPFVPKPHTVFQWAPREDSSVLARRISILREGLKIYKNVKFDFHRIDKGIVETILSRGDYRVGDLILDAFHQGEIFTAWDMDFNFSLWESLIRKYKLEVFLSGFSTDETFPWDFMDFGFKKEYLKTEYHKALRGEITPSCLGMKCSECNGCNFKFPKFEKKRDNRALQDNISSGDIVDFKRIRIIYSKTRGFICFSHLSIMKYLERIIRKTGTVFRCTEGHHPRIKMAAPPPLPIYASGENEVVELFIDRKVSAKQFLRELQNNSGKLSIKQVIDQGETGKKLTRDIIYTTYEYGGNIDNNIRDSILELSVKEDDISFTNSGCLFSIYFRNKGAERFGKIYKLIDPERNNCIKLKRKGFIFESQKN